MTAAPGPRGRTSHGGAARLARFSVVGLLNTAIDVGVFLALVWGLGMPLVPANLLAFAAAVANSYVLNRSWTFRDRRAVTAGNVAGFFLLNCVGAGFATAALWLLGKAGLPALPAKLLSVVVAMAWNYLSMRHIVFAARRRP